MVRIAERIAQTKARHKCHRHAAIISKNGNIIAVGWNHGMLHAESHAVFSIVGNTHNMINRPLKGCEILSIRIMRSKRLGLAKPCPACMHWIQQSGIKRVYYTDKDGNIVSEKINANLSRQYY